MTMIACYESDVLFYAGLSIGLWIASVVGMGCAMLSFRKKSYADQIEEMMFEHIVQQLRGINMAEAYEQEDEEQEEQEEEQEQVESDSEDEEQEEQVESEESNDADHEEEQEQEEESNDADNEEDIECIEETQTDDLPDLVEEPPAPVESPSDDAAPPSKRARRGRGRGRGHT